MKKLIFIALVAATAFSAGCFKYAVKVGSGGDVGSKPAVSEWTHHFAWGLIGEGSVDVAAACGGSDNATVVIERNIVDGVLFHLFAEGLWGPSHVEIFCGAGRQASVELDRERALAFVRSDEFLDVVAELAPERLAQAEDLQARVSR